MTEVVRDCVNSKTRILSAQMSASNISQELNGYRQKAWAMLSNNCLVAAVWLETSTWKVLHSILNVDVGLRDVGLFGCISTVACCLQ
jgi:hypothetical protein